MRKEMREKEEEMTGKMEKIKEEEEGITEKIEMIGDIKEGKKMRSMTDQEEETEMTEEGQEMIMMIGPGKDKEMTMIDPGDITSRETIPEETTEEMKGGTTGGTTGGMREEAETSIPLTEGIFNLK